MWLLILLALLCLPFQAMAQVIHWASPSGSSSASSCPESSPCTLSRATALASAGHIVRAMNGVYLTEFATVHSGTVDNPIIFESANRHGAIIRWSRATLSGSNPPLVRLGPQDNIVFRRFQIDGTGPNGSAWDTIRIGGTTDADYANNILFEDNWVYEAGHAAIGGFFAQDIIIRHNSVDRTGVTSEDGECLYLTSANSNSPVIRANIHQNIFSRCTSNRVDYKGQSRNVDVHNNYFRDFLHDFDGNPGDGAIRANGTPTRNAAAGNYFRFNVLVNGLGRYLVRTQNPGNRVDVINNVWINEDTATLTSSLTDPSVIISDNIMCSGNVTTLGPGCGGSGATCTNNLLDPRDVAQCNVRAGQHYGIPVAASCEIGLVNDTTLVTTWTLGFPPLSAANNANFAVTYGGVGQTETGTTVSGNRSFTTMGAAPANNGVTVVMTPTAGAVENSLFMGGLVVDNDPTDRDGHGFNGVSQTQTGITCANNVGNPDPGGGTETVPPYRINAGGAEYVDVDTNTWSADRAYIAGQFGFVGGTANTSSAEIAGTTDDLLYQTYRHSGHTYSFTAPNGNYNVSLHFAETFLNSANSRVFDIAIEGNTVLSNFDIWAEAGFQTALVRDVQGVSVSDGVLDIELIPIVNVPRISAIYVRAATGDPGITQIFHATDDAYICEVPGTCGEGNGIAMAVRHTAANEFRPIMKFNLGNIPFTAINSATLTLNAVALTGAVTIKAYTAASDTWAENSVNWSNAPAIGAVQATTAVSATGTVNFDVTSLVAAEVAGDKIITIYLRDDATTGQGVLFDARESGFPSATLTVVEDIP